ncbi:prolyl endopeptidase [Folsomia candida]|uniref:prolyl endopeptidase n=1 Tax=Folsomia candida TaxID=158441 RepID=UPI000B8F8CC7|nr:prolyl endopeptidase [Folsomia candida]
MVAKLICIFVAVLVSCGESGGFKYPKVRRNESVIDDYFGTKVADPYRWLEDLNAVETKQFVKDQNAVTHAYIDTAPARSQIRETLTKLWTYPKEGLPKKRGNNYFLNKNSGIQNQWILYKGKTVESLYKDEAEIFLNPNDFSTDGTVALKKVSYSKNGELLVYALSTSGSDWTKIHIKNISTGKDFEEVLHFIKFPSISWTHDHLGFFYTRYPKPKEEDKLIKATNDSKIYYHRVGTSQDNDTLMVQFPDKPDWSLSMELSDEGEYMLVSIYKVINEETLFYTKLTDAIKAGLKKELVLIPLTTTPASYSFIANDANIFYFITNAGAPNYRFVGMDINLPGIAHWSTLIPEHEKDVLSWAVAIANDKLLVSYNRDVKSTLELRNLRNGTLILEYSLEAGSIQSTEGRREDRTFYFSLATFSNPGVSYRLIFGEDGSIPRNLEVYRRTAFKGLDTSKFETNQVFYTSKDGTSVPMFIVKRKDLVLDGTAPALMYGYGGFQSSMEPFFSVAFLSFVSMFDGILAFPNIRGGGEYGTKWWDDGRLFKKQNVFDDFSYAAEYLIKANYTSTPKLAIQGGSNGGLLVAACANQRPDLYGAVVAEVGVMDMLRFQHFTVGSFWCGEYGCSEDKDHFHNLIKYSPLHNIKANTTYPAVLVQTADTDDRVVPSHSFKYTSQLQHVVGNFKAQTQPLMIRVEEKAGHGSGKPTWKQIEEYVDAYSFLQLVLNIKFVEL